MRTLELTWPWSLPPVWRDLLVLTKPRVLQLVVFCALIGMCLALPAWPTLAQMGRALWACVGIWCVGAAAAVLNCALENRTDARMRRTARRATATGSIDRKHSMLFATVLGGFGAGVLYFGVNALTLWLTLATLVGYAVVYTVWLKPRTPQNIVIGGASGAMPPVLGWAAMNNVVTAEALVLFLIIFLWTPPHFWALALYRVEDYRRAGLPMLPVTHGSHFTRLYIFLYTLVLWVASLLPFLLRMNGVLYLLVAMVLSGHFAWRAWQLLRGYSEARARQTFRFSLLYLSGLFGAMLLDRSLI